MIDENEQEQDRPSYGANVVRQVRAGYFGKLTLDDLNVSQRVLVTKPGCPRCDELKGRLTARGVEFTVMSLDTPDDVAAFKNDFPDVRSVPVLVRDGFVRDEASF